MDRSTQNARRNIEATSSSLSLARQMEAAGDHEGAMQAYIKLRMPSDAARMAQRRNLPARAAELYADAGLWWEAAGAFWQAGDAQRCLEHLLRVAPDHPGYRAAAAHAVRITQMVGTLDYQLLHFLGAFLHDAPRDDGEAACMDALARLLVEHGQLETARDVLRALVSRCANASDAAQRLKALDDQAAAAAQEYASLLQDEQRFRTVDATPIATGTLLADLEDEMPPVPPPPDLSALLAPTPPRRTIIGGPAQARQALVETLPPLNPPPVKGGTQHMRWPTPPFGALRTPAPGTRTEPGWGTLSAGPAPSTPPPAEPATPPPRRNLFEAGARIANRYLLEARIGQGGMATVYKALDQELGEHVAFKVFTQLVEDEQAISRFRQEVRLCRQITHPNVIRLHDMGVHEGFRYITMELLVGRDLQDAMKTGLSMREGIQLLIQACEGLSAAHDVGIVHRDVKPENFFITRNNVLKVMDFGIAKQQDTPGVTVRGMLAGTPAYMAPEQIEDFTAVTPRTDLYALGVLAYEMFTRTLPFEHERLTNLLTLHLLQKPQPPRERNPELPEALERIILKLLEKQPQNRFSSARELAAALRPVLAQVG